MHNKLFIVDNRLAIVGGRNIGNAYFGLGKKYNFRDLDVLVAVARTLDETARAHKLRVSPKLIKAIGEWFAETVLTEEERRDVNLTLQTEYGVGLNVERNAKAPPLRQPDSAEDYARALANGPAEPGKPVWRALLLPRRKTREP